MNRLSIFLLLIFVSTTRLAAQFNTSRLWADFYQSDLKMTNPALAGLQNDQNFTMIGDFNVTGIDGSPSGLLISYDGYFSKIGGSIGTIASINSIGIHRSFYQAFIYKYRYRLNENSELAIGLNINYNLFYRDFNMITVKSSAPASNLVDKADNIDFDLGGSYQFKSLIVGVGMQNIEGSKIDYGDSLVLYAAPRNSRQLNIYSQYTWNLAPQLEITPAIFCLIPANNNLNNGHMSFNVSARVKRIFVLSGQYQTQKNLQVNPLALFAGINLKASFSLAIRWSPSYWYNDQIYQSSGLGLALRLGFKNKIASPIDG